MQWWIYKCNSRNDPHQKAYGDWREFFKDPSGDWGSSDLVPALDSLRKGDLVIAYQTNSNEIVGLAKVRQPCSKDTYLYLDRVEVIGARVRPLKKASPKIAAIPALQQGPIRTIYEISDRDARLLLEAAGSSYGKLAVPPGKMGSQKSELATIRRSSAAASEIVQQLVPKRYLGATLKALANSIHVAHRTSPEKWGLRLNQTSIMLKVGFVEVMQIGNGWFHELVVVGLVPRNVRKDPRLRFGNPPYVNAPDCGSCDMAPQVVGEAYKRLRLAHESAIQVAARSRRHTTTTKDHSPGLIVYLSEYLGYAFRNQPTLMDQPHFP